MADNSYTATQRPENPADLSKAIQLVVGELQHAFPDREIEVLYWNANYVAISLMVDVDLPTRGPVGGIDIREQEPIFLLLHRKHYPYAAPRAYSDRRDFPSSRLPHLNPTKPGAPANFCLHRGSIDNWFAEHTIVDLIGRLEAWLRDAAGDRLIRREDGFEETRLPQIVGYAIYEPSDLRDHVSRFWDENNGSAGFTFLWYELINSTSKEPLVGEDAYAIRLFHKIDFIGIEKPLELSRRINRVYQEYGAEKVKADLNRMLFGVLIWPQQGMISSQYFGHLPDDLASSQEWAENLGIPLKDALEDYLEKDLQLFAGVPITVVVPRPQNLIRSNSHLELLNFVVLASDEHSSQDGIWNPDAPVKSMGHRSPLTLRRAREISSHPADFDLGKLLLMGCGAIGSKMALHLARSGQANITLVDYDELSPHNLVRHALTAESLGLNKAEAIKKSASSMYYADQKSLEVDVIKDSAIDLLLNNQVLLEKHTWLIDATASSMMLHVLSQVELPEILSCCRCEIADSGRLGFMEVEGYQRNPRSDDLQVLLFDLASEHPGLSRWLKTNQQQRDEQLGSVLEDIYIGLSCSSETMRLSDEIVSLHAASFVDGFRRISDQEAKHRSGILQISQHKEKGNFLFSTQVLEVAPVTILRARNNPEWEVRLRNGLDTQMRCFLRQSSPNETGGILLGLVNMKRRTIYVTRILPASVDSKGSPYAFVRGVQDIPKQVLEIQERTGGMIGYVGEWHTHPRGGYRLSSIDMQAVDKIKKNLDKIPLPTHVMTVTTRGVYPHVFALDSF